MEEENRIKEENNIEEENDTENDTSIQVTPGVLCFFAFLFLSFLSMIFMLIYLIFISPRTDIQEIAINVSHISSTNFDKSLREANKKTYISLFGPSLLKEEISVTKYAVSDYLKDEEAVQSKTESFFNEEPSKDKNFLEDQLEAISVFFEDGESVLNSYVYRNGGVNSAIVLTKSQSEEHNVYLVKPHLKTSEKRKNSKKNLNLSANLLKCPIMFFGKYKVQNLDKLYACLMRLDSRKRSEYANTKKLIDEKTELISSFISDSESVYKQYYNVENDILYLITISKNGDTFLYICRQ